MCTDSLSIIWQLAYYKSVLLATLRAEIFACVHLTLKSTTKYAKTATSFEIYYRLEKNNL